jgi:hypothetical protein
MNPPVATLLILPLIAFWLWMAWEMSNDERLSREAKLYWALAFLVFNIFAAIYYYFYGYRDR